MKRLYWQKAWIIWTEGEDEGNNEALHLTTVEGFLGNWDEALEQGKVEVVATIDGEEDYLIVH